MPQTACLTPGTPNPAPDGQSRRAWTAEAYLGSLHPADGRGRLSFLCRQGERVSALCLAREKADVAIGPLIEQESYVAMNRYHGPRGGGRRLAALNAAWVDLDVYRSLALAGVPRAAIPAVIRERVRVLGLPPPSFLIDSGRGFYLQWLLDGAVPAAEPRWRATMGALVDLFRDLGADGACTDPARVLRLPESWHEGAGRQVAVVDGAGTRCPFDAFADAVWRASGRPVRVALDARRRRAAQPLPSAPRGLSREARHRAIRCDLDRILAGWGGVAPVGRRDLWLHAVAATEARLDPAADLVDMMLAIARVATPEFGVREVRRLVGTTCRRAARAAGRSPGAGSADPRYDYSGGRLAELLGVAAADAARLGLEQIIPDDVRAARKAARRRAARRAAGALPRRLWLAANPASREQPWLAEGISRATWYRRRTPRVATPACRSGAPARAHDTAAPGETGPVPLYRGEAPPPAVGSRPATAVTPAPGPASPPPGPAAPARPPAARPPVAPTAAAAGSAAQNPYPAPDPDAARRAEPTMHQTDMEASLAVLAALPERGDIPANDAARLGAIALALAQGPCRLDRLAARTGCAAADIAHLAPWIRCAAGDAVSLRLPPVPPRRGPARDLLAWPSRPPAPPPLAAGASPKSARGLAIAAMIELGVALFMAAGKTEDMARRLVGSLRKDYRDGPLFEVLLAAADPERAIAEPMSWIRGCLAKRAGSRRDSPIRPNGAASAAQASLPSGDRPLATPEFLGLSPGRAARIREQNRRIAGPRCRDQAP